MVHITIRLSHFRSDLIPLGRADLIPAVEPLEALQYLPCLSKPGFVITNSVPFVNIPNYPDIDIILGELNRLPHAVLIDADKLAVSSGSLKTSNMVMLGAVFYFLKFDIERILSGIERVFRNKGREIFDLNTRAFESGREFKGRLSL
jgi:indolepyruvate ferredoxin oxidoreductase beta subunit